MAQRTPHGGDTARPDVPASDDAAAVEIDVPAGGADDTAEAGRTAADGAAAPADEDATAGHDVADEPDWDQLASDDPRSKGELLAELSEAEARRDEYLDDVRRARADYENLRKRMMRDGAAQRDHGKADLAGALLDVLDDFDRTLDAATASQDEGLARGVELVYGKLAQALQSHGLARIDEVGAAFDPTRHEAVQQVEAEDGRDQPVVAKVLRPGYEIGGRVIRAAMVVVEQ